MAHDVEGVFLSMLAATNAAADALTYKNTFIRSIFWDNEPIVSIPFTELTVAVPDVSEASVVDIGSGPIQPVDLTHDIYKVPLDTNFSKSFVIKEWDQARSPFWFQNRHAKPSIEAMARKINRKIVNLITALNFPDYSIVSGAGADTFNRSDISDAWVNLANVGAPVEDDGNMFFTTNTVAYGKMLADNNFNNASIVSDSTARDAQQRARLQMLLGAEVNYDQMLQPFEAGKQPGLLYHRYAIAGITRPVNDPKRPTASGVEETEIDVFGLPVRMQVWYSPDDQGYKVNYNCWLGVAPARTELASLVQTA